MHKEGQYMMKSIYQEKTILNVCASNKSFRTHKAEPDGTERRNNRPA